MLFFKFVASDDTLEQNNLEVQFRFHGLIPDWNLSTFSTRSRPCNEKNQACKWTSCAW